MGNSFIEFSYRPNVCQKKEYSGPTLLITLISGEPHLGKPNGTSLV
jgi:hypothetical protein